jgi:hypothetical protein
MDGSQVIGPWIERFILLEYIGLPGLVCGEYLRVRVRFYK